MSSIIKIKSVRLTRFNNAEYTQFLSNVEKLITKATTEKLKLDNILFTTFKANIEKLTDLARQNKSSSETEELMKLDKQRDDLVVYLLSTFKIERKTPIETKKNAAIELYNNTKSYIGTQSLPNRQETQIIEGLITDLAKPNLVAHISTLNLQDVVSQLDTVNKKYKQLTTERADNQIANALESSKKVRIETDALYDEISTRAFVASVAFPTDETAVFINSLNKLIDDTNLAYKQRMGHLKKDKGNKTPEI